MNELYKLTKSSDSDSEDDSSTCSDDDADSNDADDADPKRTCRMCQGDRKRNKNGNHETLVRCAHCRVDGINILIFK